MMTGGEPLVRKVDIIRLCEKHNDCAFHCYTNGTLVDEKLCEACRKSFLSISLEGFEDANDFRRGEGVYTKSFTQWICYMRTGLIFGTVYVIQQEYGCGYQYEFFDLLIEHEAVSYGIFI